MAVPAPPVPQTAELPSATAERAASRRGLGLLAVVAAVGALIFSIMLAGTGSAPQALSTPSETALNAPALEASGTVAVNARDAEALASQLPGIGPVYAARIVHARTFFGPLRTAADLRALGIPSDTVERVLPLISFRAPGRPGIASPS